MNVKQVPDLEHVRETIDEAHEAEEELLEIDHYAVEHETLTLANTVHPDAEETRRHHFAREQEALHHHSGHHAEQ